MAEYTTYDFSECLDRVQTPAPIKRVIKAHGVSEEGGGEWSGGFICELHNGQFAYISGWCDYTGWG